MSGRPANLSAITYLLMPGVAQMVDRHQRTLGPQIKFDLEVDYTTDNIIFRAFGKAMVLVYRLEVDDKSFADRVVPRLDHWLSKNAPKPHQRYRVIPNIKKRHLTYDYREGIASHE